MPDQEPDAGATRPRVMRRQPRPQVRRWQWVLYVAMLGLMVVTGTASAAGATLVAGVAFICFMAVAVPYGGFFLAAWGRALFGPNRFRPVNPLGYLVGELPRPRTSSNPRKTMT